MKNVESWRATKFIITDKGLVPTDDLRELRVSSRVTASLVAHFYERVLSRYVTGRLLDLGCGKVPLFASYCAYASEVTCVDWSMTAHGMEHVDVAHDLSQPLPFADASFDTIVLSDVLEHLQHPVRLWQEMFRVLAKGGKVILNVPFLYHIHEAPHDFHRYTEFALLALAQDSGFVVEELAPLGGAPDVLVDIFSKMILSIRFGPRIAAVAIKIHDQLRKTTFIQKLVRRTSATMPLGYGMVARKSVLEDETD